MDIPFSRKVLEFVEIEHEDIAHRQQTVHWTPELERIWVKDVGSASGYLADGCKTSACIAGTACLLASNVEIATVAMPRALGHAFEPVVRMDGVKVNWFDAGKALLGISFDEAHALFYTLNNKDAIQMLRVMIAAAEKREADAIS